MKFALSSRQEPQYLAQADEIRVQYRDREYIYELIEKYPDKTYILEIPYFVEEEEVDFQEIDTLNRLSKNLICRVSHFEHIDICRDLGLKWYYGMVVDKWEDLAYLAKTDTQYVLVGGDLFFNLPKVKEYCIPVRVVPNVADATPLAAHADEDFAIISSWFQPEAVALYEPYVDVIEFEDCNTIQERALFRIYSKDGWPGDLSQLISNLTTSAEGRLINLEGFYGARQSCGRKCLVGTTSTCRICYHQMAIANYEKLKAYKTEVLDQQV